MIKIEDADQATLENIDPENILDVLIKIEKSFAIRFSQPELNGMKTFGDLCDLTAMKAGGENLDDCTTQQLFYKLRIALAAIEPSNKDKVTPDTDLRTVIPKHRRRQTLNELQDKLNMRIDILDIKAWLGWTIFGGILLSLIMFFFKWEFALSGLVFFIALAWIASRFFATELKPMTVRQLAKQLSRENYVLSRSAPSTINSNEIVQKVKELFCEDLHIEETMLTRHAILG